MPKMMGPAPAGEGITPAPKTARPAKEGAAPEPEEEALAGPLKSTTEDDLELYLESGHRSPKWDQYVRPAFESFAAGNYATAGIFLSKAYEQGCRDPLALFRLAIYRESAGKNAEAANLMLEAAKGIAKRYPTHPLARAIQKHAGRALYKADRMDEALPYLQRALTLEPGDFMLLLMVGQIERMREQFTKARAHFEKALAAGPPEGTVPDPRLTLLRELVILTYQLKDFDACERYIAKVLAIDPRDKVTLDYRKQLSRARQKQKELEIIKKLVE